MASSSLSFLVETHGSTVDMHHPPILNVDGASLSSNQPDEGCWRGCGTVGGVGVWTNLAKGMGSQSVPPRAG